MGKRYDQYCPVAHALGLIGERWSLLVVRELLHGPRRYTDLAERLPGIGTNVLAARLRDLEACGVISKRTLPPPTPARVYELTEYGRGLAPVVRELALWGARSLGPPTDLAQLEPGWLGNAVETVLAPVAPPGSLEFRVGGEVASVVDGVALRGPAEQPDVVVECDVTGFFKLVLDGELDEVSVDGDRGLLEQLLQTRAPAPV
jgi:DNA-binding HxlR family transcriptional regulator